MKLWNFFSLFHGRVEQKILWNSMERMEFHSSIAPLTIQSAKSKVESSTVDGRMPGAAEVKLLMLSYASSELKADVNIKVRAVTG